MIKAVATLEGGRKLILLGISEMNVQKLKEGLPMQIKLEELGLEGEIAIMYGKTEEDIAEELSKHFKLPPP